MDVTYTYEFDAKRFERSVKRALAFSFRGATVFSWCIVAAWLLLVFRQWLGGWPEDGRSFLFVMPIFFALVGYWRCVVVRAYVRQARQMMGGGASTTCHMTNRKRGEWGKWTCDRRMIAIFEFDDRPHDAPKVVFRKLECARLFRLASL